MWNQFFFLSDLQVAILATAAILKQQKRPTRKELVKPSDISEPEDRQTDRRSCVCLGMCT